MLLSLHFGRKLDKYMERNNHLNFLFFDRRFCHARLRENMANQVNLHGSPLDRCTISDPFPKKHSDHESQKSGFRFDLKNPLGVWILWIYDPFLDFSKKRKIRFWIQESGFGFSPQNAPLVILTSCMASLTTSFP